MASLPLRFACSAWLLLAACGRETLDFDLDADLATIDAGPDAGSDSETPPQQDAEPTLDSGVPCTPDTDGDGICDSKDNCPRVANPNQNADACATSTKSCDLMLPSSTLEFALVDLNGVVVNGKSAASEVVRVQRGAELTIELGAACVPLVGSIVGGFSPLTVSAAIEGASSGTCSKLQCPLNVSIPPRIEDGSLTISLAAPSQPGGYYIIGNPTQGLPGSCVTELDAPKKLAAICVE